MIQVGKEYLEAEGLSDRVELVKGDMTDLQPYVDLKPTVISSVFALHHLPDGILLKKSIEEIGD